MKTSEQILNEHHRVENKDFIDIKILGEDFPETYKDTALKAMEEYAQQYIDRVKELEDSMRDYVDTCKQGGSINEWYFKREFEQLLNKK